MKDISEATLNTLANISKSPLSPHNGVFYHQLTDEEKKLAEIGVRMNRARDKHFIEYWSKNVDNANWKPFDVSDYVNEAILWRKNNV